ncbi:MAG: hypothetical protein ACHREM_05265 [Polyangiales bacterium]
MATLRDWADAYLAQARDDLAGARLVGVSVPSVFAMLMQMTFEKFAKAALLRSGGTTLVAATTSHKAASRLVAAMRLQKGLLSPIGGPHVWHAAFEAIEALERAHPAIARGTAQLEYPWESSSGIDWPGRDLAIVLKFGNPKSNLAAHLLDFATKLDRQFDAIFP